MRDGERKIITMPRRTAGRRVSNTAHSTSMMTMVLEENLMTFVYLQFSEVIIINSRRKKKTIFNAVSSNASPTTNLSACITASCDTSTSRRSTSHTPERLSRVIVEFRMHGLHMTARRASWRRVATMAVLTFGSSVFRSPFFHSLRFFLVFR